MEVEVQVVLVVLVVHAAGQLRLAAVRRRRGRVVVAGK